MSNEKKEESPNAGHEGRKQRAHSPQHEALLRQQALEQSEVKEVLNFFQKYAKPLLVAVIVVCAAILIVQGMKAVRMKKEVAASTALLEAVSVDNLQYVIDNYSGTAAGPIALIELAREIFNQGDMTRAEELYTRFITEYPDHELTAQAQFNLIAVKENQEDYSAALEAYQSFAQEQESSFLRPFALLRSARCLEKLNEIDQARTVYEDVQVHFPDTVWASEADQRLMALNARTR